jgi:hypothetical protein
MTHLLPIFALTFMVAGCRPTYQDWNRDWERNFQGYLNGDATTAKAALLQEEKLVAEHEARGNRSVDFVVVRTVLYTQLCGISDYLGQTNDAQLYYQKYLAMSSKSNKTYAELIEADKKGDDLLKPKWRAHK